MAGGVGTVIPFSRGDQRYNIAVIGKGSEKRGLIKSLHQDGTWEGSLYSVPFRTQIEVEPVESTQRSTGEGRLLRFGPVTGMDSGTQLSLVIEFTDLPGSRPVSFRVVSEATGSPLPGLSGEVLLPGTDSTLRYALRGQLPMEPFRVEFVYPRTADSIIQEAQLEMDAFARIHRQEYSGRPHRGGITLALLPPGGDAGNQ